MQEIRWGHFIVLPYPVIKKSRANYSYLILAGLLKIHTPQELRFGSPQQIRNHRQSRVPADARGIRKEWVVEEGS